MKIFTWFAGMLFLVAAASTTVLLLVERASLAQTPTQVFVERGGATPPAATGDGVSKGLEAVARLLEEEGNQVEVKTQRALTTDLSAILRRWNSSRGLKSSLKTRIEKRLHAARRAQRLDLLILVTQDDEVLSAEAQAGDAADPGRLSVLTAVEPFFRASKVFSGVETFPAQYASPAPPNAGSECPRSDLFLFTCVPALPGPDATHAVLIGGVSVHTIATLVDEALAQEADGLLWHAFVDERDAEPVVIAGSKVGTPLRREFYQDLLREGVSSEPAFAQPRAQLGSWVLVRSFAGQAVGGWGVTANASVEKPSMAASAGNVQSAGRINFPRSWVHYLGSATVLSGGLFVLLAFYVLRGKRSGRGRTATPKLESAKLTAAASPVPVADELVSQFEINWKTFASYTQDLFHRKLKELHNAPQKGVSEVQEQVTHLSEALVGIRDDLSVARREIKDTTHGMIEKLALLLDQDSQDKSDLSTTGEALLSKIEADFDKTNARFSKLDEAVVILTELFDRMHSKELEERVTNEVDKLKQEWNERISAFATDIEDAETQGQSLVQDLEQAREVEAELREEVEEAARREQALTEQLAEKRERLEAATKDRAGVRRRERKIAEELRTVREADEQGLRKIEGLEQKVKDLEAAIDEGKACEAQVRRDLEAATIKEEKYRETIKEIYRGESSFQKDLEEKEKELERLRAESQGSEQEVARSNAESEEAEARWRCRVEDLESQLENAQRELSESVEQLGESERTLTESRVELGESERTLTESVEELGESERKLTESREQLVESERQLLEYEERLAQSEEACRELQTQLDSEEASSGADATAREQLSSTNREQELASSLETVGKELEAVRREAVDLELEAKVQSLFRENLTQSLPALVIVDGQRRVMSWNRNAGAILGVPENDALGEDLFSLNTPLKKEAFQRLFEKAKQGSTTRRTRVRFESGGVPGQYLVTQSPFLGNNDSVRGTVLLIQELKNSE